MADKMIDPRQVLTGKDGQVFLTLSDGSQIFLAEVDTFEATLNIQSSDFQPVGSAQVFAVFQSFSVSLSMSEVVVREDLLLKPIYDALKNGYLPYFEICGKLKRPADGKFDRQVFRNCLPDGSVNLMSIQPGEIIKRPWQFRVNSMPELMEYLPQIG